MGAERKIWIELKELDEGSWGYDARILDKASTVQDYLDALNQFQEERVAACGGCVNCCWERVPLTAADAAVYLEGLGGSAERDGRSAAGRVTAFLRRYGRVRARRGVVDITLRREANGACCFLDQENHRCGRWPLRSLVCQTYVCLPASRRAAALRQQIVNEGENALIRLYAREAAALGQAPAVEGAARDVDWAAYRGRGFDAGDDEYPGGQAGAGSTAAAAASPAAPGGTPALAGGAELVSASAAGLAILPYRQVRIQDVVTADLWRLLTE